MSPAEIDAIIARVQGGEVDAFAALVQLFQRDVWLVAVRCLHDREATEELVQRTFVQAYAKLDQFQPGTHFGAWIKTIARHMVLEDLRRQGRDANKLRAYRAHLEAQLQGEAEFEDRQEAMRDALRRCREELTPAAQQALELRYHKALSFAAVAEQLDRTVAASRQLLQRARLTLRQCIEKHMVSA